MTLPLTTGPPQRPARGRHPAQTQRSPEGGRPLLCPTAWCPPSRSGRARRPAPAPRPGTGPGWLQGGRRAGQPCWGATTLGRFRQTATRGSAPAPDLWCHVIGWSRARRDRRSRRGSRSKRSGRSRPHPRRSGRTRPSPTCSDRSRPHPMCSDGIRSCPRRSSLSSPCPRRPDQSRSRPRGPSRPCPKRPNRDRSGPRCSRRSRWCPRRSDWSRSHPGTAGSTPQDSGPSRRAADCGPGPSRQDRARPRGRTHARPTHRSPACPSRQGPGRQHPIRSIPGRRRPSRRGCSGRKRPWRRRRRWSGPSRLSRRQPVRWQCRCRETRRSRGGAESPRGSRVGPWGRSCRDPGLPVGGQGGVAEAAPGWNRAASGQGPTTCS